MISYKTIQDGVKDVQFYRSEELSNKYTQYLNELEAENVTTEEIINLQWKNEFGALYCDDKFYLAKNAFPYEVECQHWLLWYRGNVTKRAIKEICSTYFNEYEILKNRKKDMSVKGINHYHVFVES